MEKILLWDFDGTLVHSNYLWSQAVYDTIMKYQPLCTASFDEIRDLTLAGLTWFMPEGECRHLTGAKWWDYTNEYFRKMFQDMGISKKKIEDALSYLRKRILSRDSYVVYEDTVTTLQECMALGYRNVILSNNYPELRTVVVALGLDEYIDSYIVSAEIGYDKPGIEIFDYARQRYPGAEFLMIGDSEAADIVGGKAAGIKTIHVHRNEDSQADYCFDTLQEIVELLKRK